MGGYLPHPKETAPTVTRKLPEEIITSFGLAPALGSDSGLAFMAKASQDLAKVLTY